MTPDEEYQETHSPDGEYIEYQMEHPEMHEPTQPQSPSEQEIADLISGKTGDPYFDSDARLIDEVGLRVAILKVMAQAADKREQEVLEAARAEDAKAAEEYRTSWLMRWTVYDEYIGRRLGRLNRQGKPAEGNK